MFLESSITLMFGVSYVQGLTFCTLRQCNDNPLQTEQNDRNFAYYISKGIVVSE